MDNAGLEQDGINDQIIQKYREDHELMPEHVSTRDSWHTDQCPGLAYVRRQAYAGKLTDPVGFHPSFLRNTLKETAYAPANTISAGYLQNRELFPS
jgi:hypothetical protein